MPPDFAGVVTEVDRAEWNSLEADVMEGQGLTTVCSAAMEWPERRKMQHSEIVLTPKSI